MSKLKEVSNIPVVVVTPTLAKEWLDSRYDNERPLRPSRVESLVRDMNSGNWYFTGDPIRFDDDGRLIDGQHRLNALIKADKEYPFPIVNLPSDARTVIDINLHRSLGDILHFGGHVDGRVLGAVTRRALAYKRTGRATTDSAYTPTMPENVQFVNDNADALHRAVKVAQRVYKGGSASRLPIAPGVIGAAYFLAAEKDRKLADEFFEKLATGFDVQPGDPVGVLRNKFLQVRAQQGRPMHVDDQFRFTVIAWNLTRAGTTVIRLQTPKGGWTMHNAPEVQ